MKNIFQSFLFITALTATGILHAQVAPVIEWQKCLGGSSDETARSIQQTTDGGFIVAGWAGVDDGDVSGVHGSYEYWIVKLDSDANLIWQKCLGGSNLDFASWIQQTTDGGFVVAGGSYSSDGDVSGNHGLNWSDYWIVKLDASGSLVWEKSLGGSRYDYAYCIQQTTDSGFIVAGQSNSEDGDVSGYHWGIGDYWVVKLDTAGTLVWQKCLGGSDSENALFIRQTNAGFIVAGYSTSNDGDVSGWHEGYDSAEYSTYDSWIVNLDPEGNIIWQKSLGGSNYEFANSIQQTTDGGFIVAGYSDSNDGDVSGNHGYADYWVVKLNSEGDLVWQRCLGGSNIDHAYSVRQTFDGGFVIAGWSQSMDGDISGNHSLSDYWIVKVDSGGNLLWQKSLGGSGNERAQSIQQTTDGGFIVAGYSNSNDGDVSGNHGNNDFWIVKLSRDIIPDTIPLFLPISLFPNPVQNLLTINLATPASAIGIRVYDLLSRTIVLPKIFLTESGSTNTQVQLTTSALAAGLYMLQITNKETGESEVWKFVKVQ